MKKKVCCLFIIISINVFAQKDSLMRIKLEPIVIKASRLSEKNIQLPISISSINIQKNQDSKQQLSFNEYLNGVPGLFALNANNFSQDLRVSIRGFGARSAFGIRGVKIIVDGIPETTPDGQGQIDNLSLSIIKDIEIIRGPSSSLYGNASGGVISINTLDNFDKNFIKLGFTGGSYGMNLFQSTVGLKARQTNYIINVSKTKTGGYRQQSGFENYNFNLRILHQFSVSSKINMHLNYTDSPFAEDAGGLTIEELTLDREQARQRNVDFKTEEAIKQFKVGASYYHKFNTVVFNTYAFYAMRDFYGLLPFEFGGIVDLNRNYFGSGSNFTFDQNFNNSTNKLQIGYDLAIQEDDRMRFRNLEGDQGEVTLNQRESFSSFALFALDHFKIGKFFIRTGIRYDSNVLKARDKFFENGDGSGRLQLNALNANLGFNYKLNEKNHVFAVFSTSFETPALSELSSNPSSEGGFNENLKAQKATNFEIGYKLQNRQTQAEVVLFYIKTKDDLVPFELEAFPDRTFFRNAGSTKRKGIEISYVQQLAKYVKMSTSYTYSDFKYDTYQSPSGNFNNNQLPAIPKHMAAIFINYEHKNGINLELKSQYVGSLYTNDSNSVQDMAYNIFNLNCRYYLNTNHVRFIPFIGINNLFDTKYNDNIRINAFGGRYYEPAPGFNFFGGLKVLF